MDYHVGVLLVLALRRAVVAVAVVFLAAGCGLLLSLDELTDPQSGAGGAGGAASTTASTTSSTSEGGSDTGDGGGNVRGVDNYSFRRAITITPKTALLAHHTIELVIDHASLAADGDSLSSGDDVRIFRKKGGDWQAVHRVVDAASKWNDPATRIHFRLEDGLNAPTESYYLYYGDDDADLPDAEPSQVYLAWEDFSKDTTQLELNVIGTEADGTANVDKGILRLEGTTAEVTDKTDSFLFVHRQMAEDVVFDVQLAQFDDGLGQDAHIGGVMVRATVEAGAPHVTIGLKHDLTTMVLHRDQQGGDTDEIKSTGKAAQPSHLRLKRVGVTLAASFLTNTGEWEKVAGSLNIAALNGAIQIGIPFATDYAFASWVDIDSYRMRRAVAIEPEVTLKAVEASPFPDA